MSDSAGQPSSQLENPLFHSDAPAPRSGCFKWFLLFVVLGGIALALLCCAGAPWAYFRGVEGDIETVKTHLADNPAAQKHLGEIQTMAANFADSFDVQDDDTWIYDVQGSKGSGKLTVKYGSRFGPDDGIVWIKLKLASGETVDLLTEEETQQNNTATQSSPAQPGPAAQAKGTKE